MSGYEPIARWNIPRSVVPATLRGIRRAGRSGHEGGAMWLGDRSATAKITTVVLLEAPGVIEQRGYYGVSPLVYGIVGEWASTKNQVLLALVHGHEGPTATWLSATDRRGGVHVPDMLSVVVPGFGEIDDPMRWGIHVFVDGRYVEIAQGERDLRLGWTDDEAVVVRASERGIVGD